jgi:hypothetical protein
MWEWAIETFGHGQLSRAFWALTGMTAPVWLLMIAWPRGAFTRRLAHPFVVPVLLTSVVAFLLVKLDEVGWPQSPSLDYTGARAVIGHPVVFLVMYASYQVLALFAGTVIHREALRKGWRAPVELVLTWLTGPFGLAAFALRLLWARLRP